MRIVDDRISKTNLFKEACVGNVFYAVDVQGYGNNPYMKIVAVEDSDYCQLNAVDLQDGLLVRIENDEPIILCNATLKIY